MSEALVPTFFGGEAHGKVGLHIGLVETREGLSGPVGFELGDGQVLRGTIRVGVAAAVEAHQVVVQVGLEAEKKVFWEGKFLISCNCFLERK